MEDPDKLVKDNLHLLDLAARLYLRKGAPGIEFGELVSHGFIGLWQAARSWNADKGASFKTWAMLRIKFAIIDGLRKPGHFGKESWAIRHDVLVSPKTVFFRDGDKGTSDSPDPDFTGSWIVPDVPSTEPKLASLDNYKHILKDLTTRERFLFDQRYLWGHTYKETGAMMGISESRASQIHTDVIRRIRSRKPRKAQQPQQSVA